MKILRCRWQRPFQSDPCWLISCLPRCQAGLAPLSGWLWPAFSCRVRAWTPCSRLQQEETLILSAQLPVHATRICRHTSLSGCFLGKVSNFSSCIIFDIALILPKISCQISPEQINVIVSGFESLPLAWIAQSLSFLLHYFLKKELLRVSNWVFSAIMA